MGELMEYPPHTLGYYWNLSIKKNGRNSRVTRFLEFTARSSDRGMMESVTIGEQKAALTLELMRLDQKEKEDEDK